MQKDDNQVADVTKTNKEGRGLTEEDLEQMSEDEMLDVFVEKLIEEKGLGEMDEKLKEEVRKDLKERLVFEINRAIVAELPDDKLEEMNKMLDGGKASDEALAKLIDEAEIDTATVVEKTMLEFREVYLKAGEKAEE